MKLNVYGRYGKIKNSNLQTRKIFKKNFKHDNRLDFLPLVFLHRLVSYLYGYDALSFAEFSPSMMMNSDRDFWKNIGNFRCRTKRVVTGGIHPKDGYYLILPHQFRQLKSGRIYNRFIYYGFLPEQLLFLMNTCQSEAFQTYARLHSYSYHQGAYELPIFCFFSYSFMYEKRNINSIENQLFCVCRNGLLKEEEQKEFVVSDVKMFERNLDLRFGFCYIKRMINFSLFILAGGSVLNCLLLDGFDASVQDLDLFWVGGTYSSFMKAINHFKRKAFAFIIKMTNMQGRVIEFILLFQNQTKIRIQFIFARRNANIPYILYTFDLDIVQVAYNGRQIISTIGFFQAISTRSFLCYNLTNNILDAPNYIDRCLKYNARGFTWISPIAYNQFLAQKPLVRSKRMLDYAFDDFYHNVDSLNVQYSFLQMNLF